MMLAVFLCFGGRYQQMVVVVVPCVVLFGFVSFHPLFHFLGKHDHVKHSGQLKLFADVAEKTDIEAQHGLVLKLFEHLKSRKVSTFQTV